MEKDGCLLAAMNIGTDADSSSQESVGEDPQVSTLLLSSVQVLEN